MTTTSPSYLEAIGSTLRAHWLTMLLGAAVMAGSIALFLYAARPEVPASRAEAAQDIGRRCVLSPKPLNECVSACSAVDGWFDHPCADAAKRTVLGDAGPAVLTHAQKPVAKEKP